MTRHLLTIHCVDCDAPAFAVPLHRAAVLRVLDVARDRLEGLSLMVQAAVRPMLSMARSAVADAAVDDDAPILLEADAKGVGARVTQLVEVRCVYCAADYERAESPSLSLV